VAQSTLSPELGFLPHVSSLAARLTAAATVFRRGGCRCAMVREEKIMVAATVACEARWRCAGCSSVAEAVSGVNEEDDGEKMEVL